MNSVVFETLRMISADLQKARGEIRALRPNQLREDGLPSAGAELEAIVRDTEAATHAIMEAAEAILAHQPGDAPADVEAFRAMAAGQALAVMEACAFQDITGQRISKVVGVLRQIEDRVSRLADALGIEDGAPEESAEDRRRRELLLHGPALDGPETDQTIIDALFEASSSQSDIDALFDEGPVRS